MTNNPLPKHVNRNIGRALHDFAMLKDGEILPKTLVADIPTEYRDLTPLNYDRKYRGDGF